MNRGLLPGLGRDPVLSPEPPAGLTIRAQTVLPIPDWATLVTVSGSGTIKRLSPRKRSQGPVWLFFTGAAPLVHDATYFSLPGATNWTMRNGALAFCVPLGDGKWSVASLNADTPPTSYTPTVTPGSGTITTLGAVTGSYLTIGRVCFWSAVINITTNGTAAGAISVTLPFTSTAAMGAIGRENAVTGKMLQGQGGAGQSYINFLTYDNAYPGGTGYQLIVQGYFSF